VLECFGLATDVAFDRIERQCVGFDEVNGFRLVTTSAGLLSLLFVSGSCQLVGGYEEFERSRPIAAEPAPKVRPCAALRDESGGAKTSTDPSLRDVVLLLVDDPYGTCFWMDETEVTAGQYREWLSALGAGSPKWTEVDGCDWKALDAKAFDPDNQPAEACPATAASGSPPFDGDQPMRCVDWCEAAAYCKWAGKRLCKVRSPSDEWRIACSAGYTEEFPFDPSTPGGACNYGQVSCSVGCGTRAVRKEESCRPAPDYPYDLGGNVEEWVDDCYGFGDTSFCGLRGGSYLTQEDKLKCSHGVEGELRDARDPRVGFRCCADLTTQERLDTH
jgi:formylglycine-generating enzyme